VLLYIIANMWSSAFLAWRNVKFSGSSADMHLALLSHDVLAGAVLHNTVLGISCTRTDVLSKTFIQLHI
jgi:hypothetical protein